jgi:hypothetical protein
MPETRAIISMKLGYRCLYVTIIPDSDRMGHVCCEDPLVGGHDDKIKHVLKVLMQRALLRANILGHGSGVMPSDRLRGNEPRAVGYGARHLACRGSHSARLEQHWPDIEKLAEQLLVIGQTLRSWQSSFS